MGKYNSSVYRVRPLLDHINNSQDRIRMLNLLLSTVTLNEKKSLGRDYIKSNIHEIRYDGAKDGEKPLRPKVEHLYAILDLIKGKKRALLCNRFNCDVNDLGVRIMGAKDTIRQLYLSDKPLPMHKAVLEGNSFPDVYIETDEEILVIEAKWTENKPTTHTTYLEHRNQMARHIQAALALGKKTKKSVIGFYIVDENFAALNSEIKTRKGFENSLYNETIDIGDKQDIIDGYFGYTTWQELQKILGVQFESKLDIDSKLSIQNHT